MEKALKIMNGMQSRKVELAAMSELMKVELESNWKQFPQQAQKIFLDARQSSSNKVLEAASDWKPAQSKLYALLQDAESSLSKIKEFESTYGLTTNASASLEKTVVELRDYFDKANKYEAKLNEAAKFKL